VNTTRFKTETRTSSVNR